MDDLEQQLKALLKKTDPSPFFEAKVLAAARQPRERRSWLRLRWAAALVTVALVVTGVSWQHERAVQEQARGEAAKARLMLALRITSVKLQEIREKVNNVQ